MKRLPLLCIASLLLTTAGARADVLGDFLTQKGLIASAESAPLPLPTASALAVHALGFMGVPYKWGGNDAQTGLDCSGFLQSVYQQITGVVLPRTSERQAAATQAIAPHELAPGDLVFFNTTGAPYSHVGIYIGEDRFVHAPRTGSRIKLERLSAAYWSARFESARRVSQPSNVLAQQTAPTLLPGQR
jgi:cell wall-associated NlpC family hydrolase